ncbi:MULTISPECIES: Brp/Blh family beta-carotene 15,15'-dioxygenase [Halostella]|uniref:Brp/Blh family beta-carotene 15,15'-dioxygenase n=1 Tax=Halostella TaxID=1843185 RepID=UPI001F297C47|nr:MULTISPECIES: Brp/Blh family beta-carotene 15,15'-dioxygenase [Halostella]
MRVLYVDPDGEARRRARSKLGVAGVEVRSAATAADGLGGIRAAGVDCVVSECRLPDHDCVDLYRGVRRIAPGVPFVLFTDDECASGAASEIDDRAAGALRAGRPSDALRRFAREPAPLTALSIALLGGFAVAVPASPESPLELTALYLAFVSVLTLPHVVVVALMDRAEGVWRPAG